MQQYPVGGPRKPVYNLMRDLGLTMSKWTDKVWNGADGVEVSIFGAGSMARIQLSGEPRGECELGELPSRLDAIRGSISQ